MNPTASAVKFREYERIYTGSNQDVGYTNPILGFTGDTVLQVFPPDVVTYFHYPYTAQSKLLSDSTLVIDGAICGVSPHFSDKVWKKMANYSNSSLWGNSQPVGKQSGVWLCSWLSGNVSDPDVKPVWKDRWYNPGYIDNVTAMFITNPASGVILDIDTEMSLDGGSYYKYFHVGNQHNETMVTLLTTNSALKLHLDDWSSTPKDLSPYNNTTTILNFTSAGTVTLNGVNAVERPDDNCLNLNGTNQYAQVLHSENYTLTGNMTCSFWAFTPDWANMNSHCIISKDYRGGWSTKYNNGFFNPYMAFIGDTGKVVIMNIEGHVVDSKTLPQPSMPTSLAIDSNDYMWVSDNLAKRVYKMDVNGDLVDSIDFDAGVDLTNITLGTDSIYIQDTANNMLSSFNIFTKEFNYNVPSVANTLTVDLNGLVQGTSGSQILVDNDNSIWTVENGVVYNNSLAIVSGTNIACDKDNNLWVLYGTNDFMKIDLSTFETTSGTIGSNSISTDRAINFTYEFNNNVWETFAYFTFANEQLIYKTDANGNLVKTINLNIFDTYPTLSTFTSYDWNRKFNFHKIGKQPQIQTEIVIIDNSNNITRETLYIPSSAVANNNWHMFTFTVENGSAKFYMDALLRDTVNFSTDNRIYYEYENPLLIGMDVGKITSLADEYGLKSLYYKGRIDDLRIYDTTLNNSDIRYIYLSKFDYRSLNWNMDSGNQNYLEEIARFFKFKLPGLKSQYYNIRISGLNIQDTSVREMIENIIKTNLKKIVPVYAELFKIIWE